MARTSRAAAALILPLGLACAACGRDVVVADLAPEEAQRCAVVLRAEGIDAEVAADAGGDGDRRQVTVRGDDATAAGAAQALADHGLPRRPAAGFAEQASGLIPTASEERARYIKGLSGEIEGLLECVDGVESAEALVSLPERRPLAPSPDGEASASVVVSYLGAESPLTEDEVRSVVVRSVGAAVGPERVSVLMKPIARRQDRPARVRHERDRVTEVAFAAAAGALAAAQALTVWRMRSMRRAGVRTEGGRDGE